MSSQNIRRITPSVTLEGCGFETDGQGTLLATSSSLLNDNRNASKTQEEIEAELRRLLGVTKVIWLTGAKGLAITDCHIDALARFGPDSSTIIVSRPNYAVPGDNHAYNVLSTTTNTTGNPFTIVGIEEALTVPRAGSSSDTSSSRPSSQRGAHDQSPVSNDDVKNDENEWGPPSTSYTNFYLANGLVVMPQFDEKRTDADAKAILARLWPKRVVEGVTLDWMAWAGEGVQCATKEWPAIGNILGRGHRSRMSEKRMENV